MDLVSRRWSTEELNVRREKGRASINRGCQPVQRSIGAASLCLSCVEIVPDFKSETPFVLSVLSPEKETHLKNVETDSPHNRMFREQSRRRPGYGFS
jgi:hypothetical protein